MQALYILVSILFCLGNDVQRSSSLINDRCARYSNFYRDVAAFSCIGRGNCCYARSEKTHLPQGTATQTISVEGIDGVMFRRHIQYVVETLPRDAHIRYIERHSERYPVQWISEKLSKLRVVNVGRTQDRFVSILPRAHVVIVVGKCGTVVAD